jgi:hypothetical protein
MLWEDSHGNLVLERCCYWVLSFVMDGDTPLKRIRQRFGAVYYTTDNVC